MANRYTCFVISPIGDPGSQIRQNADDTFEYIIKPALDKYDFVVERADHIRGITDTITKEMVERIQRSDLCVVELTGLNPNVMYECGRRHETGKPCILLSRDEKLPFDVVTHPVIHYSLEGNARDVINTIRVIQQNVQQFIDLGFERAGNRTLNDVYREVGAVGQKIDLLLKRVASQSPTGEAGLAQGEKAKEASMLIKKLGGAIAACNFALSNRDAELLDQLLPKVPNKNSENFVLGGLAQGAAMGSRVAFDMLEEVIASGMNDVTWDVKAKIIGSYSAGGSRLDEEARALPVIKAIVERMRTQVELGESISVDDQTIILNALQRIYHGLGEFEEAIKVGTEVLSLAPTNESFLYNQSLNLSRANRPQIALEFVNKLIEQFRARNFADADDDHLSHCIDSLIKAERIADARELFLVLEQLHPLRAQILRNDDDYEELFS